MLQLNNITKDYRSAAGITHALRGITLNFRRNEFVAILGPSGCGKTTLLNIVGGLDRYTSGDLIIEGKSTKEYRSRDWDTYRNHSIGFVFQSYNLIMHENVLSNVEIALTISGAQPAVRKARAEEALRRVGLEAEIHKMPNQLSGGQMQRVAIARALVNDPEVLLADEPTGALDSKTSLPIMGLLTEIARDRLVIVVTHNPKVANYASRVINLMDGNVISDTNPFPDEEAALDVKPEVPRAKGRKKKASMSFGTALHLSFKNLWTKKGRTVLVSLAGSIGIVGIALILSLSEGFNDYVRQVQTDTLSQYPLTLSKTAFSVEDVMLPDMAQAGKAPDYPDEETVGEQRFFSGITENLHKTYGINDLASFKRDCLENKERMAPYKENITSIQYVYDTDFNIYKKVPTEDGEDYEYEQVYPIDYAGALQGKGEDTFFTDETVRMMSMDMFDPYVELLNNEEVLNNQYDVLKGHLPEDPYEAVIILDKKNRLNDYVLYGLGLADPAEMVDIVHNEDDPEYSYAPYEGTFDDLMGLEYKMPLTIDSFELDEAVPPADDPATPDIDESTLPIHPYHKVALTKEKIDEAPTLTISGIIRPKKTATTTFVQSGVGYSEMLTRDLIDRVNNNDAIKTILEDETYFRMNLADFIDATPIIKNAVGDSIESLRAILNMLMFKWEDLASLSETAGFTLDRDSILTLFKSSFKVANEDDPKSILIYPKSFEDKDQIVKMVKAYNAEVPPEKKITYTDSVGIVMSSVTTIVNAITYVLIAFVSISLVVSSIMIGIITYVSVIERTKEIGILRSLGASKVDIANVFNAETMIIGFIAGLIGILATLILLIPLNAIIYGLAGIASVAHLKWYWALALIGISMVLTIIAGLIPSGIAAKKDPVVALRTGE